MSQDKKLKLIKSKTDKRIRLNPETLCLEWTGYKSNEGYGRLRFQGKKVLAHRLMWKIRNGEIPDGMLVLHRCDNPCCVNTKHLFLGTHKDNVADCIKKGRRERVMNSPFTKGHKYYGKRN